MTLDQAFVLAVEHHQAGRLADAEAIYRRILAQQPNNADTLHHLGVIAHQVGRHDVAMELIRRAIALKPTCAEAHNNLGNALKDKGEPDEAIAAYRQAIAIKPDFYEAQCNVGNILKEQGQLDDAIAAYHLAIALKGGFAVEAQSNLGNALKDKGLLDEAIAAYLQAIAIKPDYAKAHNNLGFALNDKGLLDEAIAAFRQAIALNPAYADAHFNLGNVLNGKGLLDEAVASYRQTIVLKANYGAAYCNLGAVLANQGRLDEAIAAYRQASVVMPSHAEFHSNFVYTIHFHPNFDAQAIAQEHRLWNRRHAEPLKQFIRPYTNDRNPDRRLRIGYLSPNFKGHPVGRFLLPLLAHHDKRCVEVFAYSDVHVPDALTSRLRSFFDDWRNIVGQSNAQVADMIRQDQIDILVDLTMHMAHNRLLVFARKPAPVQVAYLAYCSTTGLETMDYRLSDPYLDPASIDEGVYSEKTVRLAKSYWCYQPAIAPLEVGEPPMRQQGSITFGCLNNFCKVSEPALSTWIRLLHAVPNSMLLLHAQEGSHRQRLKDRLEREEIAPNRLRFSGLLPLQRYFELYREIDIALDTFPYAGGTTTCDALWMGVPVVSLKGTTAVGRGGFSILSNIGMAELVADNEDAYVRIVANLARDHERLSQLRATLRQRMERSPLMDAPGCAHDIEAAFRQMWRACCEKPSGAGLP